MNEENPILTEQVRQLEQRITELENTVKQLLNSPDAVSNKEVPKTYGLSDNRIYPQ